MKKIFLILFLLFILPSMAYADVDLSALTFSELLELKSSINKEIVMREEYIQATVPAGSYIVGEDIPSGSYSLSIGEGAFMAVVIVNEHKTMHTLSSDSSVGKINLLEGDSVDITGGSVIFKKYTGLGF